MPARRIDIAAGERCGAKERSMRTLAVLVMVAAATLGACGSKDEGAGENVATGDVTVTASGPVSLKVGQTLVVTLPSNPSTGYSWTVSGAPDSAVLTQEGDITYTPSNPDVVMPGSGGSETVRFTATAAGTTKLVLDYRRPWETDVPPVDTVTIDVTVTA
jgi:inhibitor of cysteine peptidase